MAQVECFVGIDVSKAGLDVAVYPQGASMRFANSVTGIDALVERLAQLAIAFALGMQPACGGAGAVRPSPWSQH